MTLFLFFNVLLLTFGPPVALFKSSILSEYGTIRKPLIGIMAYIVTQICKMLFMASVTSLSPFWESLLDCVGLWYFLAYQQKASIAPVKILSVALGWSIAESIFTRFINFYMNARSLQFTWDHLISAGEANIALIQTICFCALLFNIKTNKFPLFIILLYLVVNTMFCGSSIPLKLGSLFALSITTLTIYR